MGKSEIIIIDKNDTTSSSVNKNHYSAYHDLPENPAFLQMISAILSLFVPSLQTAAQAPKLQPRGMPIITFFPSTTVV